MNILITSLGATTAITAIKLFEGKNVRLIGTDCKSYDELPSSHMVDKFYQVPHCDNEEEYIKKIVEITKKESIDLIIPIFDGEIEVLAKNRVEYKSSLLCPPYETVVKCNDKWKTYYMFKSSEIKTPYTRNDNICLTEVIFKPRRGVGSRGISFLNNMFMKIIPEGYIAQEVIHGQEYTIDCFVNMYRNLLYCVPRKRIAIANGISVHAETVDNKKFLPDIIRLINHNKFWGHFNVQAIEDKDGDIYYIEVNPRLGASTIITKLAGIDIGQIIIDNFNDERNIIKRIDNNYKKIRMIRYLSETAHEIE